MNPEHAAVLLGVHVNDSIEQVRAGYRRRLFDVHPDHGGSAEQTRLLISALTTLEAAIDAPSVSALDVEPDPAGESRVEATFSTPSDREVVWRVDADTLAIDGPADETYARLLDVAHEIGDVTYVDRQCGVFEALLRSRSGTTISMVVTLQGRSNGSTEAFFTLEPIDAVKGELPSVHDITELVASYLAAQGH
jgi:hypothetical protein